MSIIKSNIFRGFGKQKVGYSGFPKEKQDVSRLPKRQQLINIADEFIGFGMDLLSSTEEKARSFLTAADSESRPELDRKVQKVISQGKQRLNFLHSYARKHADIGRGDPGETVGDKMKSPAKFALKDLSKRVQREALDVNKQVAEILENHFEELSREQLAEEIPLNHGKVKHSLVELLDKKACSDETWSQVIDKDLSYEWEGEEYRSKSQITCLNSGVASIIKRNRKAKDAKMINYYSTEHFFEGESKAIFSGTRAGSISEFHQKDEAVRTEANLKMAAELLKQKVAYSLCDLSKSEILEKYSDRRPLEVDVQVTSLLTPDIIRNSIREIPFFGKYFSPSNDEATQLKEEAEALEQAAKSKFVILEINKETVKVPVKMNVRLWNVGVSKLSYGQESWFLRPQGIQAQEQLNDTAYVLLNSKVESVQEAKDRDIKKLAVPSQMKSCLERLSAEKKDLRNKILHVERRSKRVKERFSLIFKLPIIGNVLGKLLDSRQEKKLAPTFRMWQAKADEFVVKVTEYRSSSSTKDSHRYLELMQEKEDITDLHSDVQELYGQRIYRDFQKVKENRYTLVAALNVLSFQLGENPHFHCKSGRDRTGGADMEIRVKYEARRVKKRFLSYRENDLAIHAPIRETIVLDSGNIDEIPMRTGRRSGLKNKNCPSPIVSPRVNAVARGIAYCYPL
ncbi:MAG: hypothetical protein ACI9S8_002528 [Chlamydiales bacterium]|jgi:hypothetical protein